METAKSTKTKFMAINNKKNVVMEKFAFTIRAHTKNLNTIYPKDRLSKITCFFNLAQDQL